MRRLIFASPLLVVLAACGGRVDEPAPTGTSAPTPGTNSASNARAVTGCAAACDRFRACTSSVEPRDECLRSCGSEFPDPLRARTYASCIEALSCDEIERGLSMNYGPIGACYSKAAGR